MTYLFLAAFSNLWIWRILTQNPLISILLVVALILVIRKSFLFAALAMFLVIFFQIKTTQTISLTGISNDDRRVIDMRLRAYPPQFLRVGYWLEERKESRALYKISQNFFENLDPNLYFFANHPRERVGIREFEKFPYILLPIFFIGVIKLLSKKELVFWLIYFFLPLVTLSLIGNQNNLGPFSLFPFFTVSIAEGLRQTRSLNKWISVIVFILVFIQIISYEIA